MSSYLLGSDGGGAEDSLLFLISGLSLVLVALLGLGGGLSSFLVSVSDFICETLIFMNVGSVFFETKT